MSSYHPRDGGETASELPFRGEFLEPKSRPCHQALRGDEVEAWLKQWREKFREEEISRPSTGAWTAIDNMVDDYQAHAGAGKPLAMPLDPAENTEEEEEKP